MSLTKAKIALVFDWMTTNGGAEKVNLLLHKMFPEAPIFTSIFNSNKVQGFEKAAVTTSFIQHLPFAKTWHQIYIGLMPYAYELFDLSEYDIVISSSHSCAKGIITKPETLHICYCHTPMRYAWDNWHSYIKEYNINPIFKTFGKNKMHRLRIWDRLAAERVDYFIANSSITKQRIEKYYNKSSSVIYPAIKCSEYKIVPQTKGYFLAVGRLTPYKKFDLIIETFNRTGLPLKIVGTGIAENSLKKMANGNIEFLGHVEDRELKNLYSECEALIFPQIEDFGITALEGMACGRPIIAFKEGGALDTIIENKTGMFFDKQTPLHLKGAIEKYLENKKKFNPEEIRNHALKFDEKEFHKKFMEYLREKWEHKTTRRVA
ncbi:glycosyltransferase [Candidatus Peregrinibacteria bacterium]|nr:glycosyltransferase [Candidatus Peregrinibacteria bacterium]